MFRTLNRSFIALLLSATAAAIPATAKPPPEFDLVRVAPGTFTMGTADLDAVRFEATEPDKLQIDDETPAREVSITRAFWLTRTEVTQAQWLAIMDTKPGPDSHWNRPDWERLPVVSVSWDDTQAFIRTLNALPGNWRYRLPTEAEWEFAARAGSDGLRPMPLESLAGHAWYIANSGDEPQPVGTRMANAWGFYDLLGNAWEWVADRYAPDTYRVASQADPAGPSTGGKRVRRGGSYHCPSHLVRPGYRAADAPDTRYSVLGFRLAADRLP